MTDDLRQPMYVHFSQLETAELLEILRAHDRHQWSEMTFDVIGQILRERYVELLPPDESDSEPNGPQETATHDPTQPASARHGASATSVRSQPGPSAQSDDRSPHPARHRLATRSETNYVRAMGPSEIIRAAFGLYRRHFGALFALAAPGVLLVILAIVLQTYAIVRLSKAFPDSSLTMIAATNGASLLYRFLFWSSVFVVAAAGTREITHVVLHRPVSVVGAYRYVFSSPVLGRLFAGGAVAAVAGFVTGLVDQGLGALVPAGNFVGQVVFLWLYIRFFLFSQAVVLEKAGVWEGFRRSWRLTADRTLRVALTWFIYLLCPLVVGVLITVLASLLIISAGGDLEGNNFPLGWMTRALMYLTVVLMMPLAIPVIALVYYSLRCEAEEYDERQLTKEL
jgi:hypothetical protein